MSKAVLLSVQPKWCELIANGKKTVEVRKTRPKLDTPFKCYIYCTLSGSNEFFKEDCNGDIAEWNKMVLKKGKVIGEFTCDDIAKIIKAGSRFVAENRTEAETNHIARSSCLDFDAMKKYLGVKDGYAWHISSLVIYDKPKKLSDFYIIDNAAVKQCKYRERIYNNPDFTNNALLPGSYVCKKGEVDWCNKCKTKPLTRPPQSWCYVEELSE